MPKTQSTPPKTPYNPYTTVIVGGREVVLVGPAGAQLPLRDLT
jgi:hypothetical protein